MSTDFNMAHPPHKEELFKEISGVIHNHHVMVIKKLLQSFKSDRDIFVTTGQLKEFDRCVELGEKAVDYFTELSPDNGFWGRMAARKSAEVRRLEKELEDVRNK